MDFYKKFTGQDIEANTNQKGIIDELDQSSLFHYNFQYFFVGIVIGCFILFISLFYLPVLVISPGKFSFLCALGSFIILASFIFLIGPKSLIEKLLSEQKRLFFYIYISAFALSLLASLFFNSYFISLLASLTQVL